MGGTRKTKAKGPPKKKRATVPKVFKCPYCAHDGACEVKLDRKAETGDIACRVCGESFRCRVTYLSDPVDVFCEWVDELEKARAAGAGAGGAGAGAAGGGARAAAAAEWDHDADVGGGLGLRAAAAARGVPANAAAAAAAASAAAAADDDFLDDEV